MTAEPKIGEFLASHGAPYYELQRRAGLIHQNSLNVGRRAVLAVAIAWGVPLLLSAIAGTAFGPASQHPYLLDVTAWARFFIAIGAFILAEQMTEDAHLQTLRQFERAQMIGPGSHDDAVQAVLKACKQRDMWVAEAASLVLAIVATVASYVNLLGATDSGWAVNVVADGSNRLTLAAWWCLVVGNPIFWFLLFRSLWRQLVWSLLLRRLARLELRIVSTHPDGYGGLGFVGQSPNAYTLFVFGISCVVGAAIAHQVLLGQIGGAAIGTLMGVWLAIVFALFAFPLTAFSAPLARLKQKTLSATGAQATRFHRAAERKVLGRNIAAPEETEAEQAEVADPSKQFDTTRKLRVVLFNRSALIPLGAAALLPLAAAGITQLPYKEILGIVKKLLLL